jgi:hypothetical protein
VDVELRFWEGCPSHPAALAELRAALSEQGLDPSCVTMREVTSEADAAMLGFIGSPTIVVDGKDIFDTSDQPTSLSCRVYRLRDGRFSPTPDPEDLREFLAARH